MRPAHPAHAQRGTIAMTLAFALLFGACSSEPLHPLDAVEGLSDLYEHMGRRRVVHVLGPDQGGKGVGLGDGTWILTGSHLAAGAKTLTVTDVDGRSAEGRCVASDEGLGLALLRLTDMRVEPAHLELGTVPISGDDVYLMVNDDYVGFSPASGHIAGRREVDAGDLLRLSAFVTPREYGGPVFGPNGNLVGLIIPDKLVDRSVRASYAQPVPALLAFLRTAGGPQE